MLGFGLGCVWVILVNLLPDCCSVFLAFSLLMIDDCTLPLLSVCGLRVRILSRSDWLINFWRSGLASGGCVCGDCWVMQVVCLV